MSNGRTPMTLSEAVARIAAGSKFADVYPEVAPADHAALRAYFVYGVASANRPVRRAVREARDAGYSGEECPACGAMKMRRNGACLLCDQCGASSGCS